MIKIWIKLIKKDKIIKHECIIFETTRIKFFEMISTCCEKIDIETPVILNKHYEDYIKFNSLTFVESDFIDTVYFDKFVLEKG